MDIDEGNTNMKKANTNKIKESISVKKVNSTKNSQRLVKISLNDIQKRNIIMQSKESFK